MQVTSGKSSNERHITCPFCESGQLLLLGTGFARCASCGLPLLGSSLETLLDIVGLPDALGAHACECDHPEMRELPDGVFHCPACGSDLLRAEATSDAGKLPPGGPGSGHTAAGESVVDGYKIIERTDRPRQRREVSDGSNKILIKEE